MRRLSPEEINKQEWLSEKEKQELVKAEKRIRRQEQQLKLDLSKPKVKQ